MNIKVILEPSDDGGYTALVPALPGCISEGDTEEEALANIREALKNHGYHLEHNFGHGANNLSEAFFLLNLLAFFFHQIFELTDLLYQSARAEFSARVDYRLTMFYPHKPDFSL